MFQNSSKKPSKRFYKKIGKIAFLSLCVLMCAFSCVLSSYAEVEYVLHTVPYIMPVKYLSCFIQNGQAVNQDAALNLNLGGPLAGLISDVPLDVAKVESFAPVVSIMGDEVMYRFDYYFRAPNSNNNSVNLNVKVIMGLKEDFQVSPFRTDCYVDVVGYITDSFVANKSYGRLDPEATYKVYGQLSSAGEERVYGSVDLTDSDSGYVNANFSCHYNDTIRLRVDFRYYLDRDIDWGDALLDDHNESNWAAVKDLLALIYGLPWVSWMFALLASVALVAVFFSFAR